jgi:hypothetical protein
MVTGEVDEVACCCAAAAAAAAAKSSRGSERAGGANQLFLSHRLVDLGICVLLV